VDGEGQATVLRAVTSSGHRTAGTPCARAVDYDRARDERVPARHQRRQAPAFHRAVPDTEPDFQLPLDVLTGSTILRLDGKFKRAGAQAWVHGAGQGAVKCHGKSFER
jgi:hypothetical protein